MSSEPKQRKIFLFGNFGSRNLGNECTLHAMLYNARNYAPNAKISCICSVPSDTAARFGLSAFPIREASSPRVGNPVLRFLRRIFVGIPVELYRWVKAIATLRGGDMLIMTGTGMLGDFGILPLGLHYDILRWSIAAKVCRCKLLFVSVGVGPIHLLLSRRIVKAALALADYRSYRDVSSKDYLESIGFDTREDWVCPDLAFSLPQAMLPARNGHRREKGEGVVGIGVMTYYDKRASSAVGEVLYHEYIASVSNLVIRLLEQHYTVRLIIGDAAYDHRVRQDLRAFLEGRGVRYDNSKIIDEPASSFEEVLSQLAETDIVVASRFHNVLLALMLTKSVVAISYHEKINSLMKNMGLAEFCQDIEHIDVDKLLDQLSKLEQGSKGFKAELKRKAETHREELDRQYDLIFKHDRADRPTQTGEMLHSSRGSR